MPDPIPHPSAHRLAAVPQARPPARRARWRRRHFGLVLSFLSLVIMPLAVAAWYLWARAADQYISVMGFSVRHEEAGGALEFLGSSLAGLSGSSSSDTDILYEFMQSQKLVADLDAALDLKALWSRPAQDPVFAFEPSGAIEDLHEYWQRMVRIYYDRSAGLLEVRVRAFDPYEAQRIAQHLKAESAAMINALSTIARQDAIAAAEHDLQMMKRRLTDARQAVLMFRNQHQLIDPEAEVLSQTELISELQAELAETLIEVDLLKETARAGDSRMASGARRAEVIRARIAAERRKLGLGGAGPEGAAAFAALITEYERLAVEREFAESTYAAALAAYDIALADAQRQSRYLAAYLQPTLAETARYPERGLILATLGSLLCLGWAILALVSYAVRDRR
ncbi:capsule biosynthesis protein [Cognatishimia sp. SS12]|uniref:capsule biosynthesis protein n=1 Tax=Cognatishimia sp. SS12 TaxID=2979465 RepID=UPI00232E0618|nr:capsule biosynthesis protein [Cognatishimia sp. SS12]MDC0739362.1 capsule biosynthesis protein [Cognatishimia sp. SS12]